MAKCAVCDRELNGAAECPVCSFQVLSVIGQMPKELQKAYDSQIKKEKMKHMGNRKVSIRGYRWEDQNGTLVEKCREDFCIGEQFEEMPVDVPVWSSTEFGRQEPGESLKLELIFQKSGSKNTIPMTLSAPDTEGIWHAGVVRKPGLKFTVVVGDEKHYSESEELSL